MHAEFRTINLVGLVSGGDAIEFLYADVPAIHRVPLALVRYSINGQEQEKALRLDLDKRAFADHLDDREQQKAIEQAAPQIAVVLSAAMYQNQQVAPHDESDN